MVLYIINRVNNFATKTCGFWYLSAQPARTPKGLNSFILTYKFYETQPRWELVPPLRAWYPKGKYMYWIRHCNPNKIQYCVEERNIGGSRGVRGAHPTKGPDSFVLT